MLPSMAGYNLRPETGKRFSRHAAKDCLHTLLAEELENRVYNCEAIPDWTKALSTKVCQRLQGTRFLPKHSASFDGISDLGFERYKYVVQVVIGEHRGEGFRMSCRCLWDSDTDGYVSEFFSNDTLFCVCLVLAAYYY
ncbi:dynein light chain Tctex-type protein 2B-like isoform X1 [Ornithodoros turicata]|uniref:dynein light chain Tctex-type protein 2B-like isoform X1 n=1 Tax=Ornithodoros turicata TaxID=34597 RepID=UPI0031392015